MMIDHYHRSLSMFFCLMSYVFFFQVTVAFIIICESENKICGLVVTELGLDWVKCGRIILEKAKW